MKRYLTAGTPIINDVSYADGRRIIGRLGGSVFYGLYALAMCSESPIYADTVGSDFETYYGKWMDDNNLTREGISIGESETAYLEVHYFPNGLWEHRPVPKADGTFHNDVIVGLDIDQLEKFAFQCEGLYLNVNVRRPFWPKLLDLRDRSGIKLMWEIATQDFVPEKREEVLRTMVQCDFHSMNLEEARILFDTEEEKEIIRKIASYGVPCFFRAGEKGAYIIRRDKVSFVPSIGVETSVDATGCGNSSTAAATVGLCEGWDDTYTLALANAIAAINARYVGLCPQVTEELRQEAQDMAKELVKKAVVFDL